MRELQELQLQHQKQLGKTIFWFKIGNNLKCRLHPHLKILRLLHPQISEKLRIWDEYKDSILILDEIC